VWPGRAANLSPPSSAVVMERVELYLYLPSGPHWACNGKTLPFTLLPMLFCGPGSSVGIATDYGLDGPGSNPSGTRFSARPDQPWGPPSLL